MARTQEEADQYCRCFAINLIIMVIATMGLIEILSIFRMNPIIILFGLAYAFLISFTPYIADWLDSIYLKLRVSDSD